MLEMSALETHNGGQFAPLTWAPPDVKSKEKSYVLINTVVYNVGSAGVDPFWPAALRFPAQAFNGKYKKKNYLANWAK